MWLDLRKAGFHAHNGRSHFSLLIHSFTNRLTFHASLSGKSLPVCFSWGLFYRPVRRPRVCGWTSQHCGWPEQNLNWLGVATRLDSDISHWFSNFLWNMEDNKASIGPTNIAVRFLCTWSHPKPPPAAPGEECLWYWWKKLSKMAGISASRPMKTVSTEVSCIAI